MAVGNEKNQRKERNHTEGHQPPIIYCLSSKAGVSKPDLLAAGYLVTEEHTRSR